MRGTDMPPHGDSRAAPAVPAVWQRSARAWRWWRRGLAAAAVVAAVLLASAAGAAAIPGRAPGHPPDRIPGHVLGGTDLPGFRQGTVAVDGGTLHYVRGGSGPALVLLPGWPETWWEWHKVMPGLAGDHTVVAFDLPGLGQSSVPAGGFDAAHTARRIHEAVSTLGLGSVQILAHDLGSLVAYPYAREFPGDVTRMAVLEAPLNGFGLENAYGFSWHFLFNASPKPVPESLIDDDAHVRAYLGWVFSSARHPDLIDQERYFRAYSAPAHRGAGFDYYRAFPANAAYNRANAATKVTVPILAMGSESVFGPGVADSFRQVATDVREVVAPDTGHWIPEENPRFLLDCAEPFFWSGTAPPAPSGDLAGCAH